MRYKRASATQFYSENFISNSAFVILTIRTFISIFAKQNAQKRPQLLLRLDQNDAKLKQRHRQHPKYFIQQTL